MGTMSELTENNNTMADDKASTQTSSNAKRKALNSNAKARRANRAMKGKAIAEKQNSNLTNEKMDSTKLTPNSPGDQLDGNLPSNGRPTELDKTKRITKQESEASSSAATAELLDESVMTNESGLANKSLATSISVGGQTDKSAGADSTTSTQSAQSASEIKAKGVELLCKFYAKHSSDKKKCLLRDVAITDDGVILITDARNRNIKAYSLEGDYIKSIEHSDLKEPFGVTVMPDGTLVVADSKSKDLKVFSIDGNLVSTVGRNIEYPMKEPRGVAVNSKGELIVSDSSRRCVYIYPIEGAFCDIIWGEAGLKPLQFKNPAYVGVTDNDDIIVSDYFSKKIALFDAQTHDLKFTYGTKPDDKKLKYPRGVTTDLDGNILIADNYNGKVHCVNVDEGNFIHFVYGDKHCIHRPRSVACDLNGHLVIIENGGRVRVFDISQMSESCTGTPDTQQSPTANEQKLDELKLDSTP